MAILPLECERFDSPIPEDKDAENMVLIVVYDNTGKREVLQLKTDQIQDDDSLFYTPEPISYTPEPVNQARQEQISVQSRRQGCGQCKLILINNEYAWRCSNDRNRSCQP